MNLIIQDLNENGEVIDARRIGKKDGGGGGGESTIAWRPTVTEGGTISWIRTDTTTPPQSQNIKGPKGDTGATGAQGPKGDPGESADLSLINDIVEYIESSSTSDTGVVTIAEGVEVRNYNGVVTIDIKSPYKALEATAGAYKTLSGARLPEPFRPLDKLRFPISINGQFAELIVNTSGDMQHYATFSTTPDMDLRASMTYTAYKIPVIRVNPRTAVRNVGQDATMRVIAEGDALTYRWEAQPIGEDDFITLLGEENPTLVLPSESWSYGNQYRCVISNSSGSVYSTPAYTIDGNGPIITQQPKSVPWALGEDATFTVAASGTGLSYQWQYRYANSNEWVTWGSQKDTSLTVTGSNNNRDCQYRCIVTGGGKTIVSFVATLST